MWVGQEFAEEFIYNKLSSNEYFTRKKYKYLSNKYIWLGHHIW